MKKLLLIIVFIFFSGGLLFSDDYRWDLVNALTRNDYPAIENIINRNINSMTSQDRRLVMNFAVTYSHGDTTLRVLSLLQSFNVRSNTYDLFTAINRNQPDNVIQFITNNGGQANGEVLLLAMEKQRFDFARQFIQAGVDVNYTYPPASNYADGMTALLYATRFNNFEMVQLLVERGANINARNRDGSTAFSIAQMNGNAQISNFLLERGAAQTGPNPAQGQPRQSGGIAGFMDDEVVEFQPGNYRLSAGNREIRFTGTANYGNITFVRNNSVHTGSYQTAAGNLTIIMDGRLFMYKIDSAASFSGNGEVWTRTGN